MGDAYPFPGIIQLETQAQWEEFFSTIGSGVIEGLAASLNSGTRQAVMASGRALLQGFLKPVESSTGTAIPAAGAQNRVDRLVLRLNRNAATPADLVKPTVLQGASGSTTAPALTRSTSGNWDLPIARWTSQSNGALTGLIDEREWLGSRVRKSTSNLRPLNPAEGDIIRETDTGRWLGWTGTAWVVIYPTTEDTGWADLGFLPGTGWVSAGENRIRRLNGVCYLRMNLEFDTGGAAEFIPELGSPGAQVATIPASPAGLRPSGNRHLPVILSHDRIGRLIVTNGGAVHLTQTNGTIQDDYTIRVDTSFIP